MTTSKQSEESVPTAATTVGRGLLAPHVLDRELYVLDHRAAELFDLEARLEAFVAELRGIDVDERDEHGATRTYVRRLADAGLLDLVTPHVDPEVRPRVSAVSVCLARQWLSRESGALDTAFVMQGLGSFPLLLGENESLAREVFPRIRQGHVITGFALTEPEAGSDVAAMQTTAEALPGGRVRLRGEKCFISNAGVADAYSVFAREGTDPATGKPRFSCFWIDANTPGLRTEAMQVIAPHPIGRLFFDDVEIDESRRLGAPGKGMRIALANLDQFRPTVGAAALGMADRALHEMVAHLQRRKQFGKALAEQQGLRFAIADLAAEHMAAHLLVYRAARARDEGRATSEMVAMAKLSATETAQRVIDRAVQSFGGRGVTVGEVPERLYREIRALRIYEGTSEIQKLVIARALFDQPLA
jgi:acyl-CoA dehydrogenase